MKFISNKTLFNIHGWLGLNVGLFLFIVCFSGTFATISSEIDWLLNEDLRIEQKDAPIRWQAMYKDIQETYPEGDVLGIYKNTYTGHGDHFATVAYVGLSNGQTRKVYLDPYEGKIQGDTSFLNVQRFFRTYHRRMFDGERGIFLVTLSSFFLLFSALTGFLFYKGWLKNLFKLRLTKGIKTLFSDAHKLAGIWSLVFTLLIALTGVFYFVEIIIQAADRYDLMLPEGPEPIERVERAEFGVAPELLSLDEYIANAKEAFPELEVLGVRVPKHTSDYVYIDGQAGNPITRNRANKVYLHPFTGEVEHIQGSSELNTAEFITDIADPLHFGYFGGLTTKVIWFIFGLALSFAILSGTYLWYVRGISKMERKLKRRVARQQPDPKKVVTAGFVGKHLTLSRGAVISTALTLLYLFTTAAGIVQEGIPSYGVLPEERLAKTQTLDLDPWSIDLVCEYPCTMQEGTNLIASFNKPGLPNYESLNLVVSSIDSEERSIPFSGSARQPSLVLDQDIDQLNMANLSISIESLDGKLSTASLSMSALNKAQIELSKQFESNPDRRFPEVSFGIYAYILSWCFLTLLVIVAWTYFLIKATNQQRQLLINNGYST